jgi:uncharacterized protein
MEFRLEHLNATHVPDMWRINEEGLPGVGKVSDEAMADLLSLCELALGAFSEDKLLGFVLCLLPRTRYGSPNYAWFHERLDDFLYVDRIAVAAQARDQRVGTTLYARVISHAQGLGLAVAAEVSLAPPNPGSMRFHGRHGFSEIGTLKHQAKAVAMMLRSTPESR